MKLVLFEDDPKASLQLRTAIKRKLPSGSDVVVFLPTSTQATTSIPLYEDRLAKEVQSPKYRGAVLWVTDRDLSRTPHYQGLSEAVVSKVAAQLGVAICKYARGAVDDNVFNRQRSWGDAQIVLEPASFPELGAKIATLAKGFLAISSELAHLTASDTDLGTPAQVMAHLLKHPELADQIALYGSGDQKMVGEILPFAGQPANELRRRLPSLLGYWLYDSILRFPGLLMNAVAAASYLDIASSHFKRPAVRALFATALYKGPFRDAKDPHWWRASVDEIIRKAKANSGNDFVAKRLKEQVPHCFDSETRKRAGWYCMVKKVPVSEENSVGNISWFPPGADLARIRKDVYEQMGPWLGLF